MKTARDSISIFTWRDALKRLIAEYKSFDTASRLCADYCLTGDELARVFKEIPKPKRVKPRMTFVMRTDKTLGEAYLAAQ